MAKIPLIMLATGVKDVMACIRILVWMKALSSALRHIFVIFLVVSLVFVIKIVACQEGARISIDFTYPALACPN